MTLKIKEKNKAQVQETKIESTVALSIPQIPEEIFLALFGVKTGSVTNVERGINPGFTILQK